MIKDSNAQGQAKKGFGCCGVISARHYQAAYLFLTSALPYSGYAFRTTTLPPLQLTDKSYLCTCTVFKVDIGPNF